MPIGCPPVLLKNKTFAFLIYLIIFGETLDADWMPTGFIEKQNFCLPDLFHNFWRNFALDADWMPTGFIEKQNFYLLICSIIFGGTLDAN